MATFTPNYGLALPVPNSPIDANTWGTTLNTMNFATVDTSLKATALSNIGNTAPSVPTGSPLAGQMWINTNSSSTTAWFVQVYDGTSWITTGTINPTDHTYTPAGFVINPQTFTANGTYTPTTGMQYCIVELIGAGGGSGGAAGSASGLGAASGGAAGGYARKILSAATIGASKAVIVGVGGIAGAIGNNNGGTGGTTSLGSIFSATGGTGGLGGSANTGSGLFTSAGSLGGTGSGGDINTTGAPGGGSIYDSGGGLSGFGGSTFFGGGAPALQAGTGAGLAGASYGAGASGAITSVNNATSYAGAAGANGLVSITEFI
jgi:hypothetical protein